MRTITSVVVVLFVFVFMKMTVSLGVAGDSVFSESDSMHDKIYMFENRILPKWTHESKGEFFDDLINGRHEKLIRAAGEIVGEEFSKKMTIQAYPKDNGILITFPTPDKPRECFFIYISKVNDGYRFFTYEKTFDSLGPDGKGVVGEWTAAKAHVKLGSRKYDDADSFVAEMQKSP